jgi:hypothetical protein
MCEFAAICPMFDDGSNVEGVIESVYKVLSPLERYTRELHSSEPEIPQE